MAGNVYITTDDGSYGRTGVVTKVIEDLVQNEGKSYDLCVAIGPMIMMKFTCMTTKKLNIPTVVSMNPIMVDGTGMCGACRLTVGDEVKLLNEHGEFLNKEEGNEVLRIAEAEAFEFADIDHIGSYREDNTYNQKHIDSVLALKLVDVDAIRKANFRVAIDCVNSVGGIILPELLERLGVKHVEKLYCEATGDFQHNPEPLEKNLGDIMGLMAKGGCDVEIGRASCRERVCGMV